MGDGTVFCKIVAAGLIEGGSPVRKGCTALIMKAVAVEILIVGDRCDARNVPPLIYRDFKLLIDGAPPPDRSWW